MVFMKNKLMKNVAQQADLMERVASVTEQLEDIVTLTKGRNIKEPVLSLPQLSSQMQKKIGGNVPLVLFAIFRMFALKNLLRGRMFYTAHAVGRQLGLDLPINSPSDFKREIGKFEIGEEMVIKKLADDGVNIQLSGTITSMGIRKSAHPICYFERGLLSGAAERLLKKRINLIEETCCSKGDRYCTFTLRSRDEGKLELSTSSSCHDSMSSDMYSKENLKLLTTLASHSITAIENTLLLEEAKRQSIVDGLTGVYNHAYFQQVMRIETSKAARYRTALSLIIIDVDRFKNYNDKFGHHRGDVLLKALALLLKDAVREVDIVSRYGGDEFAIILPQTGEAGARIVVNRIQKGVSRLAVSGSEKKRPLTASISMGVASIDGSKLVKADAVFRSADRALLTAKRLGRNRSVFAKSVSSIKDRSVR